MKDFFETFAGQLYAAYCKSVGNKAFNGDPLPDWNSFRADESKKLQSDAWLMVAKEAEWQMANHFGKL